MSDRHEQGRQPDPAYPWAPPPYPGPVEGVQATGPSDIPVYVPPPAGQYGLVDDRQVSASPPPPPPQLRPADWVERVGATLVDWVLVFAPITLANIILPSSWADNLIALAWLAAVAWVAWLNGAKGQSPGKALMGLRLVRESDGTTLGGPVGLVRSLTLGLMFIFTGGIAWLVSVLWPLWDQRNRALHDKMFRAVVMAGYPRAALGKGIFRP